ncbi:hypothetical protein KR032_012462 [Drosophila birchii]|nr:hypothetical protein KR032_012462 [Drosophila birchii]
MESFNSSLDSSQKSGKGLGQSTFSKSNYILRKLSEEDMEETFDSAVALALVPEHSEHVSLSKDSDCKDPSIKRIRASDNWQLLLHKLGEKKNRPSKEETSSQTIIGNSVLENRSDSDTLPAELKEQSSKERAVTHWRRLFSEINKRQACAMGREAAAEEQEPSRPMRSKSFHESLKYKRSKDPASHRMPTTSSGSTSSKVVSDLKRESFSLPPQQACVVREEPPKFAKGLLEDRDSDWCWQQSGLISVDISPNSSSSFAKAKRRSTSQVKRHATTGRVSTSGEEVSAKAAKGKSSSISSGSTGHHFPNFRQRQQELHRYRVLIEQRRLDLLELRIAREREEAKQYMILFQKKMQAKECNIRGHEACDCSNI